MASECNSIKSNDALSVIKAYKESPFVKHQLEELVLGLYQLDDPLLLELISKEMKFVQEKDPCFKLQRVVH